MKALILAGGQGSRLKPLTDNTPKCLVKIGNKTILEGIIDPLVAEGITDFDFLLGHLSEKVKEFVSKKYSFLNAKFFVDPPDKDPKAWYIFSMGYFNKFLRGDDVLYLHGDVFCDSKLIEKLAHSLTSSALINKSFTSEKDFNALIVDGKVKKIGRLHSDNNDTRFCMPSYKLLKQDFDLWLDKIEEFVKDGKISCYAEDALNEILENINFLPLYFNSEIGMEIDDMDDYNKLTNLLKLPRPYGRGIKLCTSSGVEILPKRKTTLHPTV